MYFFHINFYKFPFIPCCLRHTLFSFVGLPDAYLDTSEGSARIGNKIDIAYRGSLIGTKFLDEPKGAYSPFEKSNGDFILVSGDKTDADIFLIDLIECINRSGSSSASQDCISIYNSKVSSSFLTDKVDDWASNQQEIVKNAYFDGNDFVAEKNIYSTQWPQFTLTFDAEWAGVHWITGEPKVVCPSDDSFISGESKSVVLDVENVASEKGAFSLSFDCDGASSTLTENKLLLDSGGSKSVTATLTTSTEDVKKVKCSFRAYATRESAKLDECSFNIEVKPKPRIEIEDVAPSFSGITGAVPGVNKSSSAGLIILVVFLILVGGSAGFFFYKNRKGVNVVKKVGEVPKGNFCTKCGKAVGKGVGFCTKCGTGFGK